MIELRCQNCNKKLGAELKGEVRIVCPRCKHFNVFQTAHTASWGNLKQEFDKYAIINTIDLDNK